MEETINYEISRTTQTEVIEGGDIRRLSVAVAIDHAMLLDAAGGAEAGEAVFQARSEEEMAQIAALVRSAIGFEADRGDVLEVVNMRFAQNNLGLGTVATPSLFDLTKADIMGVVEIIALFIGGMAVLFFVVRPLLSTLLKPVEKQSGLAALPGGRSSAGALPNEFGETSDGSSNTPLMSPMSPAR